MKRYVYWRQPDGRPYKGIDGKHSPANILAELGMISVIDANGVVGWQGLDFTKQKHLLTLLTCVIGPNNQELNEADTWTILYRALVATVKIVGTANALTSKVVLDSADREASSFFQGSTKSYVLVSSLSVDTIPIKSIRLH